MALMFFHIPRTGGSSVWHSLAVVAARQNKIIADLYHQSKEMVGHPFAPNEAIQYFHDFLEKTNLCFDDDVIYHHHTYHNVPYLLESDQIQRVTIIRDPVSRVISEAFHMRRFLRDEHAKIVAGHSPGGEYEFHREKFGESLFNEFIAIDSDPDALVLNFARLHQNYYLSYFSHFLHPQLEPKVFDEHTALDLARQVCQAFIWVGKFPILDEFINVCGLLTDLDVSIEQDMQHITNSSDAPSLKPETLAQVKAINLLDYVFTDAVLAAYDRRLISRLIDLKERRTSNSKNTLDYSNAKPAEQAALEQEINQERLRESAASAELAENLAQCRSTLEEMRNSISWQVTKPLRMIISRSKR
ncbi:hypothetical protein DNK59_23260 [Pseudomonas sp. TKO26]|uniref:sulfotransferase family 2 domain-containing protein n=1 Tax=unclassified Pseudomonas TaxID=196821 RepID=UPI000D80ABD8|nr:MULTISPECIES: sulfotransferase family 2 domain-containing protein [unclassified Pseudomonas]PYY81600.1 hypothetical protein DNK62_23260 [Pseudomonas sp. TKO30]PYY82891.1 hypothetical protein DNK61_22610 [Pseudomonas sp. TKO29]PYY84701.1 hypothetical protein DNK59_23260 [Pseudomonas sp. TKO26]PYY97705.1 hypothetical protein DNK60_24085 [Pseudomonas sp. TKO14]